MTADEPGTGPAAAPAAGGRRRATPPAHSSHRSRGPRAGGPRRGGVTATGVLAVLVPLLTVAAFVLVRPGTAALDDVRPPSTSDLTRATLVCPAGTGQVEVGTASGTRGTVSVRLGDAEREVAVRPGRLSAVESDDAEPAEVTGLDDLAPGLLAGRFPTDGATRTPECRAPLADQWFTGAGAAARHSSVLELVNPDGGPAVVDVVVHGRRGEVDAPSLRGVSVPGNGVVRVALAEVVPRRGDLALHVTTSRGRVAASVLDRVDQLGAGASSEDWLGAQAEPAETAVLLGVARGQGRRQLVVGNASDDEARVTLSVVADDAVFAPEGVDEVVVPPQGVARIGLARTLTERALEDGLGLLVESTRPVTASVRSFVDGDLSLTTAGERLSVGTTTAVVPAGPKQLLLAGAERAGVVVARTLDADGAVLDSQRAELAAERGTTLDLPDEARLLRLRLRGTGAVASVALDGEGGAGFLPLRDLLTRGLVADVRPARR